MVVDGKTNKIIATYPYVKRHLARRLRDKKDKEYGAYRYRTMTKQMYDMGQQLRAKQQASVI